MLATDPNLPVFRVPVRSPASLAMRVIHRKKLGTSGFIPPFFRKTMGDSDPRLPELESGLGVVIDERARYYPMRLLSVPILDEWGGRLLRVSMGEVDGSPHAIWDDDGSRPMQMLSRWYGFSYTFPDCEIWPWS